MAGVGLSSVSVSDSVDANAVWVNRLARWVGAGGKGMGGGVGVKGKRRKNVAEKTKAAWGPRRLL
jgi:hypothetical protein